MLDVAVVHDAEIIRLGNVLNELLDMRSESNQYVAYEQVAEFVLEASRPMQLNLDGEPYRGERFEFSVAPKAGAKNANMSVPAEVVPVMDTSW